METKDIIKWWGFPSSTVINRNIPKNKIYSYMKNSEDKKFLQSSIQSIYILANFKTYNTHISEYEDDIEIYQEIQFLYVKTRGKGNTTKIYNTLAGLIPYPLIILMDENNRFTIYAGRFKKIKTGFLKLIKVYSSPEYDVENIQNILEKRISLVNLPRQNMKVFYDELRNKLATASARVEYGGEVGNITIEEKDQLDYLKKEIEKLRVRIKKERQLNRKIDMQIKLRELKKELSDKLS